MIHYRSRRKLTRRLGSSRVCRGGYDPIPASQARLAELPALEALRAKPYNTGLALFAAMGGRALQERLDGSADRVLLLVDRIIHFSRRFSNC